MANIATPCETKICWYFGKVTRDEAEAILLNGEANEGSFLVRESSSALGDYVLSLVHNKQAIHYQIRRHGDDAFFSIDEGPIIHGLEVLIAHYQDDANGLSTKLEQMCLGKPPPSDCRRHGRTNLLHRATKEGNVTVVTELLMSGYHSIDAKNQDGQTALHLASIAGHDEILVKLLNSGASVNTRDSAGLTPLHYACQKNQPTIVRILLAVGGANIQARSSSNNWVPLHEAAFRGYHEVVKVLLSQNAPCYPRTNNNETPLDLARSINSQECIDLLEKYMSPSPKTKVNDWFHDGIDRTEALKIMKLHGEHEDGAFLVRRSMRKKNVFVLTMMHNSQPYNFEIHNQDQYYYIDDGPYMKSLEHVVEHYSSLADGLPTHLTRPIKSDKSAPISVDDTSKISNGISNADVSIATDSGPIFAEKELKTASTINPSVIETKINDENLNHVRLIHQSSLRLGISIGEGEFGSVLRGALQTADSLLNVAVKTLREENMQNGRESFLREASVMMGLDHHCIVKLLGVCPGPPLMLVQELLPMGSMLDYLLDYPNEIDVDRDFKLWAAQIACGMMYLESKHFVHRDLAARNILISSKQQVKVSDFGLSRAIGLGSEYYRASSGGRWPVKWYAPESVNYGTFSHASDVWSYGITLWEMYSFGEQPYGEKTGAEVLEWIEQHKKRLHQPEMCPDKVYEIIMTCWSYQPECRPSFRDLTQLFSFQQADDESASETVVDDENAVSRLQTDDDICLSDPIYV